MLEEGQEGSERELSRVGGWIERSGLDSRRWRCQGKPPDHPVKQNRL